MKIYVAPNFKNIFPDEIELNAIDYIKKIPKEFLLKFIGLCNTNPTPNYYNFFSNPEIAREIQLKVELFNRNENDEIEIITPYSYLKFSELVLSNINSFEEIIDTIDNNELNLFKAILVLNNDLNDYNHNFSIKNGIDVFVNFVTLNSFQLSEISNYKDDKIEFIKLIYSTIYKVENLLKFLTEKELLLVKKKFIKSFDFESEQKFLFEMKYLFAIILIFKDKNQFIFTKDNFATFALIKNISSNDLCEDEDFTELKKMPIYFINENSFSIVNYYFAVDLFYRSAKFRLNQIFNDEQNEIKDFFSYYTTEFSEKFLMKNLLDNIFSKKYFSKKIQYEPEKKNEPDYYVNYDNTIIIFENKDVLINKKIKSARDINTINEFLKDKFFHSKKKGVGINQLINSIESIFNKKFEFDEKIIYSKKIEIFPILLVHDRIFQSFGINYILNNWFKEELSKRNIISDNKFIVHSLTVLDIDTLIFWNKNIKDNFGQIKRLLLSHIKHLNEKPLNSYSKEKYFNSYLQRLLRPISSRATPFSLPNDFSNQLLNLINDNKSNS